MSVVTFWGKRQHWLGATELSCGCDSGKNLDRFRNTCESIRASPWLIEDTDASCTSHTYVAVCIICVFWVHWLIYWYIIFTSYVGCFIFLCLCVLRFFLWIFCLQLVYTRVFVLVVCLLSVYDIYD